MVFEGAYSHCLLNQALLPTLVKGSRVLPLMLLWAFQFILKGMFNDSHIPSSLPDPALYFLPLLSWSLISCIHHILKALCSVGEGTICLFQLFLSVFDFFFLFKSSLGHFVLLSDSCQYEVYVVSILLMKLSRYGWTQTAVINELCLCIQRSVTTNNPPPSFPLPF